MQLQTLFYGRRPVFSLEIFPPKKNSGVDTIYTTLDSLKTLSPDFISVTYGAGGNTADTSTVQIASHIKNKLGIEPLAHLTCVASTKEQVAQRIQQFKDAGIENVLALRGDINPDVPPANDFQHASDLAQVVKAAGFNVVGACYPEGHYENKTLEIDIDNLKYKIDAGVTHLITQLFFDNTLFYRFLDTAAARGVTLPVEAGIMPIVNTRQIERTVALSGASLPPKFTKMISKYDADGEALFDAGVAYAVEQINDLLAHGVSGIHLYTMNNPKVAQMVYTGVRAALGR
jgi:methylenetetrahydrofolate reductase (NADPH)